MSTNYTKIIKKKSNFFFLFNKYGKMYLVIKKMTIEKSMESLDKNTMISSDVKGNLIQLIAVFNRSFPSVSLDNLNQRLETLKIEGGSKFLYDEAIQYAPDSNRLVINQEMLNDKEVDARFNMMKAVLSIVSAKGFNYGFGDKRLLRPLNIGTCEIIANYLVGNDGKSDYLDEQTIVNTLADTVGSDNFINAFFTNDSNLVMKPLYDKTGNMDKLNGLLEQIDNNMSTRKQMGFSRLGFIQKDILSMYESGYSSLMSRQALEYGTNLKYKGTDELEEYLKSKDVRNVQARR